MLVSIGGQNGYWPADSACGQSCVLNALSSFFDEYHCDGLDVDLEGSHVASASSLVPVIKTLRASGSIVSAAPEAAQVPLEAYASILPLLDYLTPQFYNNPPNAVTTPFIPTDQARWPKPWAVSDWQTMSDGEAYWFAVLKQTCALHGLGSPGAMGMLIPATPSAASNNNLWDIPLLKAQMQAAGIKHVGTWCAPCTYARSLHVGIHHAPCIYSIPDGMLVREQGLCLRLGEQLGLCREHGAAQRWRRSQPPAIAATVTTVVAPSAAGAAAAHAATLTATLSAASLAQQPQHDAAN